MAKLEFKTEAGTLTVITDGEKVIVNGPIIKPTASVYDETNIKLKQAVDDLQIKFDRSCNVIKERNAEIEKLKSDLELSEKRYKNACIIYENRNKEIEEISNEFKRYREKNPPCIDPGFKQAVPGFSGLVIPHDQAAKLYSGNKSSDTPKQWEEKQFEKIRFVGKDDFEPSGFDQQLQQEQPVNVFNRIDSLEKERSELINQNDGLRQLLESCRKENEELKTNITNASDLIQEQDQRVDDFKKHCDKILQSEQEFRIEREKVIDSLINEREQLKKEKQSFRDQLDHQMKVKKQLIQNAKLWQENYFNCTKENESLRKENERQSEIVFNQHTTIKAELEKIEYESMAKISKLQEKHRRATKMISDILIARNAKENTEHPSGITQKTAQKLADTISVCRKSMEKHLQREQIRIPELNTWFKKYHESENKVEELKRQLQKISRESTDVHNMMCDFFRKYNLAGKSNEEFREIINKSAAIKQY